MKPLEKHPPAEKAVVACQYCGKVVYSSDNPLIYRDDDDGLRYTFHPECLPKWRTVKNHARLQEFHTIRLLDLLRECLGALKVCPQLRAPGRLVDRIRGAIKANRKKEQAASRPTMNNHIMAVERRTPSQRPTAFIRASAVKPIPLRDVLAAISELDGPDVWKDEKE